MAQRIYVGTKSILRDSHGERVRSRVIRDLGIGTIDSIRTAKVYVVNGTLDSQELTKLAEGPFSDPIVEDFTIDRAYCESFNWMVEIGFLPGVTDNVGRTATEAAAITLRRDLAKDFSVHTATQYFIDGSVNRNHVERIARSLLANELIESVRVYSQEEWMAVHTEDFGAPVVQAGDTAPALYREIDLSVDDRGLMRISKDGMLALSLPEMQAIRDHYASPEVRSQRVEAGLPANPTNVELEILAQTWSEHCKHKIFNARITYREDGKSPVTIDSLFKEFIQKATSEVRAARGENDICLSVFKDNAGVVRFNDQWAAAFKVETHNSPSALDPYGGALTGIVGVNRDPFGTGLGSRLVANTDVFCFASPFHNRDLPPRILHPKRVLEGVREGVEHGGNKSGIPTVNGCLVFDERFLGKPLVYCGTVGLMPIEIDGRKGYEKKANVGDRVVMVGGRIGKDGIHGATFSSEPLHEGSPATAVQIGDPITQKRMTDFLLRARDNGLYSSITDNGAGGLSSSVGETAEDTGGATVYVDRAPLKYHGLEPWEIIVSEAQERMTVAVPPERLDEFMALADEWNVEATDLGDFNDSGYFTIKYGDTTVGRIPMAFLHDGLPTMELNAAWEPPVITETPRIRKTDLGADLTNMMKRLNICSKEYVVRQYDHEVQGGSVVKPLCGARNDGPSDAAVFRPLLESPEGLVVSNGIVPRYSDLDTYAMASSALDEAVRNAVCVGAHPDHMAALDNFCWCDPVQGPDNPDGELKLGRLVRANQALYDLCTAYGVPLVSGKDSMKNDYRIGDTKISIPPTVLVSVIAKIPNAARAVTMDFKKDGNPVYILGLTRNELGGSEYAAMKDARYKSAPLVHDPAQARGCYRKLFEAINTGSVAACHDLSDGGLGVALAEMCFAGEMGVSVELGAVPQEGCTTDAQVLFSESQCRLVLEVDAAHEQSIAGLFAGLPFARIGTVRKGETVEVTGLKRKRALAVSRIDLKAAWRSTLDF